MLAYRIKSTACRQLGHGSRVRQTVSWLNPEADAGPLSRCSC